MSGLNSRGENKVAESTRSSFGLLKSYPFGEDHATFIAQRGSVNEAGMATAPEVSSDHRASLPHEGANGSPQKKPTPVNNHRFLPQGATRAHVSPSQPSLLKSRSQAEPLQAVQQSEFMPHEPNLAEDDGEHWQHLQRRASRAWGLFQLTKAVSHWSVWADEKLDRAEVARRHMTRYRHFGSWRDKTADVMIYSRALLLARSKSVWQHAAELAHAQEGAARVRWTFSSTRRCLTHWESLTSNSSSGHWPHSNPSLLPDSIAQWWAYASHLRDLRLQADDALRSVRVHPSLTFWRTVTGLSSHALYIARHQALRFTLWDWEIVRRSRQFSAEVAHRDVRRLILQWRNLGHGRLPVQRHMYRDRHGAEVSVRCDGPYVLAATQRHNALGDFLAKWRSKTLGHAALSQRISSLSAFVTVRHAIALWHGADDESDTLQLWSSRANQYLTVVACLKKARQLARPSWSHTTRTLYARARWRQKHLNVRRMISLWRKQTRANGRLEGVAHDSEVDMSARRLIQSLHSWQEECEALLTSSWSSHLPNTWLSEWAVSDELLHLLQDEAATSWEACLRSRTYNKWRALSVQFHSQSYVVGDVVEKNSRKLTRRIILHWRQSGAGVPQLAESHMASQSTHQPRTSIWSRTQARPTAASSMMDFGHARSREESPSYNSAVHDGLLTTPTRWTGLNSSLARLPTTTPQAPLSTPFERELRTRYNRNLGSTLGSAPPHTSIGQTPRLSAVEARRIAEERRRHRPL